MSMLCIFSIQYFVSYLIIVCAPMQYQNAVGYCTLCTTLYRPTIVVLGEGCYQFNNRTRPRELNLLHIKMSY